MNATELLLPFAGGLVLSGAYFAVLWLTVRRLPQAPRPLLTLGISFLLRVSILIGGFYLLIQGRWERLAACMAGFFIARTVCVVRTKASLRRNPSRLKP